MLSFVCLSVCPPLSYSKFYFCLLFVFILSLLSKNRCLFFESYVCLSVCLTSYLCSLFSISLSLSFLSLGLFLSVSLCLSRSVPVSVCASASVLQYVCLSICAHVCPLVRKYLSLMSLLLRLLVRECLHGDILMQSLHNTRLHRLQYVYHTILPIDIPAKVLPKRLQSTRLTQSAVLNSRQNNFRLNDLKFAVSAETSAFSMLY